MRYQTILRTRATIAEQTFYRLIANIGLHIVFQKYFNRSNGQVYFPDFQLKINRKQLKALRLLKYPVKASKQIHHRILVEIDGKYHDNQQYSDKLREQEIQAKSSLTKYHFLRFTNDDVLYKPIYVLKQLYKLAYKLWGIELQFKTVQDILMDFRDYCKTYDF